MACVRPILCTFKCTYTHTDDQQTLKSGHLVSHSCRVTPEGNSEFAGWARMAQVSMNHMASCVIISVVTSAYH